MSIRPFRNIKRKKTKVIKVGKLKIGGDNPISVQSMTNTLTTDIEGTIKQINAIEEAGEKAADMANDAGDKLSEMKDDASSKLGDMKKDAGNAIEDACEKVKEGVNAEDDDC